MTRTPDTRPKTRTATGDLAGGNGRSRLILVAMRLFAERGFDAVTVRDIAAEAGVSLGLINHHFVSKQGLREAVDAYFARHTSAALDRAAIMFATLDVEHIAESSRQWAERYAEDVGPFTAYLRRSILDGGPWGQRLMMQYFDSMRRIVDQLDARGGVRPDADRLMLPLLYVFLVSGPIMLDPYITRLFGMTAFEPEMYARFQRAATRLFLHGAGVEPREPGLPGATGQKP